MFTRILILTSFSVNVKMYFLINFPLGKFEQKSRERATIVMQFEKYHLNQVGSKVRVKKKLKAFGRKTFWTFGRITATNFTSIPLQSLWDVIVPGDSAVSWQSVHVTHLLALLPVTPNRRVM